MDTENCETPRESQVRHELNASDEALTALGDAISQLEGRLSGVLRQEPPRDSDNDSEKPAPELVPLAHEIRSIRGAVLSYVLKLHDFMNRMEL